MGEGVSEKQHLIGSLRLRFIGKVVQLLMKKIEFQQKFDNFRRDLRMAVDQGFVARGGILVARDEGHIVRHAESWRNNKLAVSVSRPAWEMGHLYKITFNLGRHRKH